MFDLSNFDFSKRENGLTIATIFIPVVIYIAISSFIAPQPTWKLLTVIGLSTVYFLFSFLIQNSSFFSDRNRTYAYFVFMAIIGTAINFIAPPGFMWIILAPLLGIAEQILPKLGRWAMYIVTLLGAGGPYIYQYGWDNILTVILYIPAVLFIVVFTRIAQQAHEDRSKAEELTRELENANKKLGEYAIQAEELAMTQERNRIAREIHDNLGHYLTVINVQLEAAKVMMDIKPEKAMGAVEKAQNLTKEGLGAIRNSIAALRDNPVANRPIPDAIADLIRENEMAGIDTDFSISAEPRVLPPNATLTLYRIVQEALTNVRKHANASQVSVHLDYNQPETVQLKIHDNGVGSAGTGSGFGLMGITERVAALNGTLDINTAPDAGFAMAISIPG